MESKSELSCSSPAGVHGPSTDTSGEKKTELSGEIDDLIKAGSESPTSAGASQKPDATSLVDDLMRQETPKYLPWGMFSNKDYIKKQVMQEREVTARSSASAEHLMGSFILPSHPFILHKYIGLHGDAEGRRISQSFLYDRQEWLLGRLHENILSVEKQLKKLEVLLLHVATDHDEKHQELKEEEETAGSSARAEHLMVSLGKDYDGDQQNIKPGIVERPRNTRSDLECLRTQLKGIASLLRLVAENYDEKQKLEEREKTAGSSSRAEYLMGSVDKDYDERHSSILHTYERHHGDAKGWSPWRSPQSILYERQERLQRRLHESILSVEKQQKKLEVLLPRVAKDHDEKHQELKEEETAGSSVRPELLMGSLGKDYDGEQAIKPGIVERPRNTRSDLERLRTQLKGIASMLHRVAEVYYEKPKLEEREKTAGSSVRPELLMGSLGNDYDGEQLTVKPGSVEITRNAATLDPLKTHLKKLELLLPRVTKVYEKLQELKERKETARSSASAEHLMGSLGKHKLKRRHKTAKVLMCPTEESHYVKEQKLEEDRSTEMLSGVQNLKAVGGNRLGSGSCGGETLNHGGSELLVQSESTSDDSCKILEKTAGFPALFSPLVHQGFVQYFPEKDQVQMFTPFITDDFEDETYRFQGSSPGLFQCTVTGLVFHMEGEGEVCYRIVTWNRRLLSQHHKKPAGPLFDIKCLQQSVCQLHLPHCEILSTGGGRFLSVAHIKDEGIEFIKPHDITETHVIINITGFSGFGNVKDEDSPPDPVQALVLLFYKPPDDKYPDRSSLSMLLVPRNIVIRDVRRTRHKLNGPERYIDESPHCKLKPKQVYTLSTSHKRRVKVQPAEAEFDEEIHNSFFTSFKVILKSSFEEINLSLTDKSSSSCVWEREVCLSPSTAGTTDLTSCQKLLNIRSTFIEGVSGPVLQTLLDKLLETKVMADSEVEEIKEMPHRRHKARRVLDSVRRKGEAASSKMVEFLCEVDPFFSEHLGLTLREMEQ
ncbi:uncharacterized protein LOC121629226 [Melanotaenia boesemani]|uniref:uncharacterized protein LOC121629226 n=1 Tax=Melanotaenia boesemani TaxID=1250792 RepID=UPI001C059C6A|nr:uncharacterized protein LOC121629226 [Melanotaenia boesemani]XP_041824783.1 uncharacterized protein LOC121629226 [Melanotaenia boesemani]XP_041824784.1 uncharacterized protein LOC121629226 [Melanotaenia boesemani]